MKDIIRKTQSQIQLNILTLRLFRKYFPLFDKSLFFFPVRLIFPVGHFCMFLVALYFYFLFSGYILTYDRRWK